MGDHHRMLDMLCFFLVVWGVFNNQIISLLTFANFREWLIIFEKSSLFQLLTFLLLMSPFSAENDDAAAGATCNTTSTFSGEYCMWIWILFSLGFNYIFAVHIIYLHCVKFSVRYLQDRNQWRLGKVNNYQEFQRFPRGSNCPRNSLGLEIRKLHIC